MLAQDADILDVGLTTDSYIRFLPGSIGWRTHKANWAFICDHSFLLFQGVFAISSEDGRTAVITVSGALDAELIPK